MLRAMSERLLMRRITTLVSLVSPVPVILCLDAPKEFVSDVCLTP